MCSEKSRRVLIPISEMAGWFGVSLSDAVDIVAQGHIPCAWVNGEVHVCERALNAWIERQFNFPISTQLLPHVFHHCTMERSYD